MFFGNLDAFIEIGKQSWIQSESTHGNHIHMAGDTNNNRMESLSGNTVRYRERVIRGLKKDDSVILAGLRLYHNHVRPHLTAGRPDPRRDGQHPYGGPNKRKAIIQAAAKQKSDD